MRRAVVQHALLHLFWPDVVAERGIEDHERRRDPPALHQEPSSLLGMQMSVEMTGEDPVEAVVAEGQRERVGPNERVSVPGA
jgi:hypothetical protein